jgi:hypothetical protein
LRHAKDPYIGVEVAIVGKSTGHFSPTVTHFPPIGLSRRSRRGGAWRCKWELPKQVSTISLHCCCTSGGDSLCGSTEKEEEVEEEGEEGEEEGAEEEGKEEEGEEEEGAEEKGEER